MSQIEEFLSHVSPNSGIYCLASPFKKGGYQHIAATTIKQLAAYAKQNDDQQNDTFFAVGTLKQAKVWNEEKQKNEYRTHANMSELKALILDIDCNGSSKAYEYPDQTTAANALRSYCKDVGVPAPTVVNSGRGLHVYWTFTESISADTWFALSLKALAVYKHYGLKFDPSRTKDKSSILRVAGTSNYKDPENPKPVKVLRYGEHTPVEEIEAAFDKYIAFHGLTVSEVYKKPEVTNELASMFGGVASNIQAPDPININLVYQKCRQMAYVKEVGGPAGYNLRASACSIIKCSENPDYSVLESNDPNVEVVQAQTDMMLADTISGNPHTCETFENANPGGCRGCQEKVKSPVVLGHQRTYKPSVEPSIEAVDLSEDVAEDTVVAELATPQKPVAAPDPYICDSNGIRVTYPNENGGLTYDLIYEYEVYPFERVWDYREKGEAVRIRAVFPHDGIREFSIPTSMLADSRALAKELTRNGVIPASNDLTNLLVTYMSNYIRQLQKTFKATHNYAQLGWHDDLSKFVLPSGTFNVDGTKEDCGVGEALKDTAKHFQKAGTLEAWREVIDVYAEEGNEGWAFGHLVGYGAVLFSFTGYDGAIASMVGHSGSGKSTVLQSINSIFGHPKGMMSVADDTYLARMNRIGELNSICCTYDEVTDIDPQQLSALAYAISNGRGKHRLNQSGQSKENHTHWRTMMACSTNIALHDILGLRSLNSSPQSMRIFEWRLDPRNTMSSGEAKRHFDKLQENYGHAGEIFVDYVITHQAEVKRLLEQVDTKFELAANVPIAERYWSAIVSTCIVGGLIAKKLNLNSFNVDSIFKWAVNQTKSMRAVVSDNKTDAKAILVDFLNTHVGSTITVVGTGEKGKPMFVPTEGTPKGQLMVRSEPDNGLAFVPRNLIKRHIQKIGGDYYTTKRDLMASGILMNEDKRKVLTADSNLLKSGPQNCWMINTNHKDMAGATLSLITSPKVDLEKTGT